MLFLAFMLLLVAVEKLFIPQVCIFKPNNKKWKGTLSVDLRNMIKDKKRACNTFIKISNPAILLKYKKISNIVRNQTRNLQKKIKQTLPFNVKLTLKYFENYSQQILKQKQNWQFKFKKQYRN